MNNIKTKNDFNIYRCYFLNEGKNYIKAKDYLGKKYLIKSSKETKCFKKGYDDTFYAKMEVKGIIIKRKILHVIDFEKYIALPE